MPLHTRCIRIIACTGTVHAHATYTAQVLAGRAAPGGRLCAMVPVRSEEHTRLFLAGLASRGVRLHIERVDSAWVARVVSPHCDAPAAATPSGSEQWPRGGGGLDDPPHAAGLEATLVTEGAVLFVRGEFR